MTFVGIAFPIIVSESSLKRFLMSETIKGLSSVQLFDLDIRENVDVFLTATLFLFCVIVNFPGYLDNDPFFQFRAALSNNYNNIHPPMMGFVWAILAHIHFSPAPLMIFHNLMFFAGALLVARFAFERPMARGGFILLISVFPSLFVQRGAIFKDVALASSFLFGFSILLGSQGRPQKVWWAIPFLLYGTGVRQNSIFALLPLCVLMACGLAASWSKRIKISLFLFLGMTALAFGFNELLSKKHVPFNGPLIHFSDLAGMSLLSEGALHPLLLSNGIKVVEGSPPGDPQIYFNAYLKQREKILTFKNELSSVWREEILRRPVLYLKTRWLFYRWLVGANQSPVRFAYCDFIRPNPWGFEIANPQLQEFIYERVTPLRNSLFFRGWVFVVLLFVFSVISLGQKSIVLSCLALSGFLYAVAYFFIAPNASFRLLYWPVTAVLVWPAIRFSPRLKLFP